MKTCTKCGETKPLDDFHKDSSRKDGRRDRCKFCIKVYMAERYNEDPEKEKDRVKSWQKENPDTVYWYGRRNNWIRYGIIDVDTLSWEGLIESQQYKCKVCGAPIDVYTAWRDHDHETGLTRGAVCSSKCNAAMDEMSD